MTAVSVFCFLCSDGSLGRRDSGTFSCSGRRLEETAGLSEGESVQWHKPWYNFIIPPVTKEAANGGNIRGLGSKNLSESV